MVAYAFRDICRPSQVGASDDERFRAPFIMHLNDEELSKCYKSEIKGTFLILSSREKRTIPSLFRMLRDLSAKTMRLSISLSLRRETACLRVDVWNAL